MSDEPSTVARPHASSSRKALPSFDFTVHTLENGDKVSTVERFAKGSSWMACQPPKRDDVGIV